MRECLKNRRLIWFGHLQRIKEWSWNSKWWKLEGVVRGRVVGVLSGRVERQGRRVESEGQNAFKPV